MAGNGLEHGRRHQPGGTRRHHHANIGTGILQAPDQVRALVGGDAAGDAENDTLLV
jgi:hypothetical protein